MNSLPLTIIGLAVVIALTVGFAKIEKAIDENTTAMANMFEIPSCKLER